MHATKNRFAVIFLLALTLTLAPSALADRPADALRALQPDSFHVVDGPVEVVVPAGAFAPYAETAADSRVGERTVEAGTRVFAGELVAAGALLNTGGSTLGLRLSDGRQLPLAPGQGVVVREAKAALADSCAACSVSCGSGYYACCERRGLLTCADCYCVPNDDDDDDDCDAGGVGSTGCSVGEASIAEPRETLDPEVN